MFFRKHAGEINQLYCSLPSVRSAEIVPIINYCENHLVRFFSVPNVRNYLKRRMHFELLGNVPVLSFVVSHWNHWRTVLSSVLLMLFVQGYFLLRFFRSFIYSLELQLN